jgi:hypothetical protein
MAAKFVPGLAGASAAGCAFVGSVAQAAVKPIEVAARHPKVTKAAALGAAGATVVANTVFGDEDDGFDDEEEEEE